jgi:HlyD family secretion protein
VAQAEANVAQARAQVDNARVQVTDAQQKFGRAQELAARQLIARSELDAATVAVDTAKAQLRSAEAGLVQAEASLNQNRVNLDHTTITAPIDGIVIERSVDVGQTVAASLQSPTIFAIAADLAQMRVSASVDESDIGKIRPRQPVTFGVDAYAGETFTGAVSQIRLQPTVVQNVTTYSVVIDVPNPQLKLKPGMTANVAIEVASRDEAVLVPNPALRFRPTAEMFTALGQPAPPPAARASRQSDGARNRTAEEKADAAAVAAAGRSSTATSVDALFAPLSPAESEGTVWLLKDGRLEPMAVRVGISDGQTSELLDGGLTPGTTLVTNIATQAAPTRSAAAPGGLFMPPGGPGSGPNRTAGSNGRQSAASARR